MQQRSYHGNISAEGLADYLIQHYTRSQGGMKRDKWDDLQAQKIGKEGEGSFLVQIGHGELADHVRRVVTTIGIAQMAEEGAGIVVTMGQRQWITQEELSNSAIWIFLAALLTPWFLFGLLWPLGEALSDSTLTQDIWNTVDVYAGSQGAAIGEVQTLIHPHLG